MIDNPLCKRRDECQVVVSNQMESDAVSEIAISATPPRKAIGASADHKELEGKPKKKSAKSGSSIKLQIDFPGGVRLGPGKVALLEAIDSAGSLSRAAAQIGMSYRRAWLFMQQINQAFDQVAVSTPEHGHGGGPAKLTDFGRELIRQYRSIEKKAIASGSEILSWLDEHRSSKSDPKG
jgi:molybdate transport system regulatory protein